MTSALRVTALSKAFGHVSVLRDLSLDVPDGALVAILGASGGGKTTLLRLVCGFEHADNGAIAIGGVPVAGPGLHRRPEQRRIGYVAQDGALFPHLSVGANILFGLDRAGRRDGERPGGRAEQLLELVGLPAAYAARPPQALSGGEQQRVALARALAPAPRLVLLDEPFSALDAGARAGTRRAVAAALSAAGATALLVTHDQGEALSMGDQVGVLRGGRLAQLASPAELYRYPADAELARFVGEAVLLDGVAGSGAVSCALGRLPLARPTADGPVRVMIRPEQIAVAAPKIDDHAIGRVVSMSYHGHDAGLSLLLADGAAVSARIGGLQALTLRPGAAVGLCVMGLVIAFPRTTAAEPICRP